MKRLLEISCAIYRFGQKPLSFYISTLIIDTARTARVRALLLLIRIHSPAPARSASSDARLRPGSEFNYNYLSTKGKCIHNV